MRPTALIRPPGPRLAEGLVTHIDRVPVGRGGRPNAEGIVDIGEFEKLEGCVTCLSVRLRPTS